MGKIFAQNELNTLCIILRFAPGYNKNIKYSLLSYIAIARLLRINPQKVRQICQTYKNKKTNY